MMIFGKQSHLYLNPQIFSFLIFQIRLLSCWGEEWVSSWVGVRLLVWTNPSMSTFCYQMFVCLHQ